MTFQALLFCPDEKTARVTTQVLTELEFGVEACTEPFTAVKKLMGQHFDAIVVDCENEQNASLLFKSARNSSSNQASLAVAVVEGQAGVANAFRIGANLVLTKPINVEQAKSTLRVARGLLRKGGEASKPSTVPAPATPASIPSAEKATPSADLLPTSSTAPVRPAVLTSSTKPSAPAMAAFKSQPAAPVSKAQAEPTMSTEAQRPAANDSVPDVDLFETSEHNATARDEKSSSQNYPWQGTSKPAANLKPVAGLTSAAEQKMLDNPVAAAPAPLKQAQPTFTSSVVTSGGAASAPAPAKEIPKPQLPTTALEAELAISPLALPKAPEKAYTKPVPKSSIPALTDTAAQVTPTFSALESSEDAASGGSKKGLLIAAAVLVVAVAGYFGYAKFSGVKHSAPKAEQASPSSTAQTSSIEMTPAAPSTAPASATVVASPSPATKTQASATSNSMNSASPKDTEGEESDVTVTHLESAPKLVVKSGLATKPSAKSESTAEVAAPSLGVNEDQSAISNIVQSTTAAVPKVAPQQTLKVSQGVTQGLLLRRVQPVYPPQALQMHIQGAVQVLATINKEGKITSLKVLSGDPILSRAATEAVSQWRYKPYFLNGEPVEIQTQIVVNFKLP